MKYRKLVPVVLTRLRYPWLKSTMTTMDQRAHCGILWPAVLEAKDPLIGAANSLFRAHSFMRTRAQSCGRMLLRTWKGDITYFLVFSTHPRGERFRGIGSQEVPPDVEYDKGPVETEGFSKSRTGAWDVDVLRSCRIPVCEGARQAQSRAYVVKSVLVRGGTIAFGRKKQADDGDADRIYIPDGRGSRGEI